MNHEKVEEKLSKVLFVLGATQCIIYVVEEYISSCYIRKCFGGGRLISCVALSEDEVVPLNLVLDFSIKPSW